MTILMQKTSQKPEPEVTTMVVYQTEKEIPECLELTRELRAAGITTDYAYSTYEKPKHLGK